MIDLEEDTKNQTTLPPQEPQKHITQREEKDNKGKEESLNAGEP